MAPVYAPPATAVSCTTPFSRRVGKCLPVNDCTGATYKGLCSGSSKCCVRETTTVSYNPTVVTRTLFNRVFYGVGGARLDALYPYFVAALVRGSITSCYCKAAFMAQLSVESGLGLGTSLVDDPEQVCMPSMGFQTTVRRFWTNFNLNSKCATGGQQEFKEMTRIINGGNNGIYDRWASKVNARSMLGCPVPSSSQVWALG